MDVLLYGDSVFLAGIKAQLERCAEFALTMVAAGSTSLPQPIGASRSRALVFDFAATKPDFAVPLLRAYPDLLLIGVDPSSNELLVLSCRSETVADRNDLVNTIRHGTGASRAGDNVRS